MKKYAFGTFEDQSLALFWVKTHRDAGDATAEARKTLNDLYPEDGLAAVDRDEIDEGLHILIEVPTDTPSNTQFVALDDAVRTVAIFDLEAVTEAA